MPSFLTMSPLLMVVFTPLILTVVVVYCAIIVLLLTFTVLFLKSVLEVDFVYFEYAGQVVHLITVKVVVKIMNSCGRFVQDKGVGDSPTHTSTTINLTTALAIAKSTSHPITHNTNSKRITLTATISSISTTITINIMCNNMTLR